MSSLRKQCVYEGQGQRCPNETMPPHPETIWCFCVQHQQELRFLAVPVATSEVEGISALTHAAYLRSMGYPAQECADNAVIIGPTNAPTLYFYSDERPLYEARTWEEAVVAMVLGQRGNLQ